MMILDHLKITRVINVDSETFLLSSLVVWASLCTPLTCTTHCGGSVRFKVRFRDNSSKHAYYTWRSRGLSHPPKLFDMTGSSPEAFGNGSPYEWLGY
ncbi:hypothetical protein AG1IA_02230 [Rhizoctonia solani AG-1 IA]|uniref:Uncharacterized protein n=1 Tax=Thanatephorus cucumeris (strain AG1-IA) TaxID=983506 RepID=L8X0J7_THACA|nr:hypothetical protein AG1IA_02230 [Rhizoctonia solani AG-1 IA]